MSDRLRAAWLPAGCVVAALAACAARVPEPPPPPSPPPAGVPSLPGSGVPYEVTSSDVTIEVYRDGPLAELGHNHVIGSSGLTGWVAIAEPLAGSSFVLVLPVAGLTVDEPARLAAAGPQFPDRLSPEDKEATRRNMLSAALLDADRFSLIRLESAAIEGSGGSSLVARTRATVAGRVREIEVPVTFGFDGASLHASGEMTLSHQELGLVPFSAVMGALRVGEELHVSWRIEAQPVAGES